MSRDGGRKRGREEEREEGVKKEEILFVQKQTEDASISPR